MDHLAIKPDPRPGLSERAELYRVLQAVPALVAITHGPDHTYEFANAAYLKFLGKTESIIGQTVSQVFPELKGQGILEILDKVYRTGKEYTASEHQIELDIDNDGNTETVYFNFVYQPMRDLQGRVSGIISHAVEVSPQVNARRKAEENEQRYRALFNSIDEGFCTIEMLYDEKGKAVDYRFIETNKVFEEQAGLKDAAGKRVRQLLPDIEDRWIQHYARVAAIGKSRRFTDGSEAMDRWFDVHASRIGEPGKRRVALLFKDITGQKLQEMQQQAITRQVTEVLESMGDAFFMLDQNWTIVRVNKVMEKVTKVKRKDVIGKYFWDVFPDNKNSKYWIEHHKVMRTRKPSHFVERYAPLDLWTETDVYPTSEGGISVFFRDVTASKKASEALQQSEERLRFMAESMPQKVFTANPDGRSDYYNPQWMEYTGLKLEDMMNWGWTKFIHPRDLDSSVTAWNESIRTGKAFEIEQRFRGKDGKYHWHISRAQAMRDESGVIIKWIGSSTDIDSVKRTLSRKKHLEVVNAALTEQRAQLIELGKAKDEFISLASHQLRTPATGVKQYLGMVLEEYAGEVTAAQRKMLEQAYQSNEREIAIINDLLKVAQVDAGKVQLKRRPADIGVLVEEIIDGQHSKFEERGQKVDLRLPKKDVIASVDPERLRMVLENIVDNAGKYTPQGKRIEVRLESSAGKLEIAVTDQGVGISQQDMDKLFMKFSRLDNPLSVAVGGTGLGLYWAKKIIDLHGGTIEVESKVGEGSTFTVRVPV